MQRRDGFAQGGNMRPTGVFGGFVGGVSFVAFVLMAIGSSRADGTRSVWQGAFTKAQAERGKAQYFTACASCHGVVMQGDGDIPELVGKSFLKRWGDQPVGALFTFATTQMPIGRPGSLGAQGYADVVAHILSMNGFPEGKQELPPGGAALDEIIIEGKK
jgi:S-disulfanyl-L-cysteine oxidoreductase SoxD